MTATDNTEVYYFKINKKTYIAVLAIDFPDALLTLKEKYRYTCNNHIKGYTKEQWQELNNNIEPSDVLWSENSLGHKPEGFNDLYVFIPEKKQIIQISEGTGDNLLPEDITDGYVDYIYYEQYQLSPNIENIDGGQVLLKEMFRDKYTCTADSLKDVLEMAYGSSIFECHILI
ncbi:MAG: hypothetical protein NC548_47765 [Lachnospiraceae bacterium]|nr:hypothetical protein [Lachnospiraceae bacterium]